MSDPTTTTPQFDGIARGVRWSTVSAMTLRASQFVMGIVAARIIAPHEFGAFAVALTVYGVVLTISDAGVQQALIREVTRTREIGPTATTINYLTSFVTAGVMGLCAGPLARALGAPSATDAIRVLSLTLIAGAFGSVPATILARDYRQRERYFSDAANFVVSSIILVALALSGWGVMALAISRLVGQIVSGVILNLLVHERYRPGFDRRVGLELLRFSLPLAGANAMIVAISNVDTVTVARIDGTTQLGYYNLAFTIASWPVGIFSSILMNITVTTLARVQHDPVELRSHLRAALGTLAAASLPVSALLMSLATPVIDDIYGPTWTSAAPVLVVLGLFASVRVIQVLLSDLLIATGRTRALLVLQAIWLVALIPTMIAFTKMWGPVGAAWAHVAVGVLIVLPTYLMTLRNRTHVGASWIPETIAMPIVGSVLAGGAAWWVAHRTNSPVVSLVLGGLAGVVVYLAVMARWLRTHVNGLRQRYLPVTPDAQTEGTLSGDPGPPQIDPTSGPSGAPYWLGRRVHPVAAWVHTPEPGTELAGSPVVVLVPPVGRDQVAAHRALRQLAMRYAARGYVAVRFAFTGTGDSWSHDTAFDVVSNWRADVQALAGNLVAMGAREVHLVGLRLGALVAASTPPPEQLGSWASVVLWDPVPSGRHFVRQQQVVLTGNLEVPIPDDGGAYGPGIGFTAEDVAALRTLTINGGVVTRAGRVALVARETVGPEPALSALGGPDVIDVWTEAGQEALLEADSMLAKVPQDTLERLVDWVDGHRPSTIPDGSFDLSAAQSIELSAGQARVRETFVTIDAGSMPGTLTEPVGRPARGSLLMLPPSSEQKDGPTGLWTTVARELAAHGYAVLRADKRGAGDAVWDFTPHERPPYSQGFIDDIPPMARWLADRTATKPAAVGLCSGSYLAAVPPNCDLFSTVIGMNMLAYDLDTTPLQRLETLILNPGDLLNFIRPPEGPKARLRGLAKEHMPHWAWRFLGRRRLARSPDEMLMDVSARTRLVIMLCDADLAYLRQQRGMESIDRAARAGHPIELIHDPQSDHALFGPTSRRTTAARLLSVLDSAPASPPRVRSNGHADPVTGGILVDEHSSRAG